MFSLVFVVAVEVIFSLYGGSLMVDLAKFLAAFTVRLSVAGDVLVLVLVVVFAATGSYSLYKWFRKKSLGG